MVVSLHIGTGGFPMLAKDAPAAIPNVMASFNAGYTLTDLLFSGVFARFPALQTCLAESQLGWIPYVLSRADFVYEEMSGEGFTGIDRAAMPHPPSWYFARNVWVAFFRDPVGLELLDRLGASQVLYETDYPHTDTMWPTCQEDAAAMTAHLDPAVAADIVAHNAAKLFRIDIGYGIGSGGSMDLHDPTNGTSEPTRYWSTANIGEAMPDVLSPMCWSFWGPDMEAGARLAYYDFGILPQGGAGGPRRPQRAAHVVLLRPAGHEPRPAPQPVRLPSRA